MMENESHLEATLQPQYLAGTITCVVIVMVSLILRLIAQRSIGRINEPDNWVIVVAATVNIFIAAATIYGLQHGIGKHQARVDAADPDPPNDTIIILKVAWVTSTFQNLGLLFTKVSILLFFKRVFTTGRRRFQIALIAVSAYSILVGIGSTIEFAVQCLPVSFLWERAYTITGITPPHPLSGWCMPQDVHAAVPLVLNLLSDLLILALPAIGLWGCQMRTAKKAGILLAFSVGLFVCIVDCIRIYYAFKISNSGDFSWDNAGVLLWTAVEGCVSVICACIPAMAPLLKQSQERSKSHGPWHLGGSVHSWKSKMLLGLPGRTRLMNTESTRDLHQQALFVGDLENVAVITGKRAPCEWYDIPLHGIQVSHAVDVTSDSLPSSHGPQS